MNTMMRWQWMALGVASLLMASACSMDGPDDADDGDPGAGPDPGQPPDLAPTAIDDLISTVANTPGSTDVLGNDGDPSKDVLKVASFTQGSNGTVAIAGGVARYMPAKDFTGFDKFQYTIVNGRGLTATATVGVMVNASVPGCSITVTGPATGTYGVPIHLSAAAACSTGPAQVQWYYRRGSYYVIVQPFSATSTLDLPAEIVGNNMFYALVRTQGTTPSQGMSNIVTVKAADNTPQCTLVKMVTPTNTQSVVVGRPVTLTASATCPAGGVPEYQFWVKQVGTANWQILPAYTTTSSSWTPPSTGAWAVRAVVRSVGSHVNYQMASMSVTVNATP